MGGGDPLSSGLLSPQRHLLSRVSVSGAFASNCGLCLGVEHREVVRRSTMGDLKGGSVSSRLCSFKAASTWLRVTFVMMVMTMMMVMT